MYKGGRELLTCIEDMTTKVSSFRVEQRLAAAAASNGASSGSIINTLQRSENPVPPAAASETKGLLSSPAAIKCQKGDVEEGVKVTIENGILSLKDKKFQERDTSINPDLD